MTWSPCRCPMASGLSSLRTAQGFPESVLSLLENTCHPRAPFLCVARPPYLPLLTPTDPAVCRPQSTRLSFLTAVPDRNLVNSFPRSGNPGYLVGRPLLAGTYDEAAGVVAVGANPQEDWLTVPSSAGDGSCASAYVRPYPRRGCGWHPNGPLSHAWSHANGAGCAEPSRLGSSLCQGVALT